MTADFDILRTVIDDGIQRGLHTCVQVYVSIDGTVLLNDGFGMATESRSATNSTLMLWRSAGKPLTAAGILRLAERGQIAIDDPVAEHLPEATGTSLESIPISDLLAHASGLPVIETLWPDAAWTDILTGILSDIPDRVVNFVAYQPQATWFLLGEILRRKVVAETFGEGLCRLVLEPLGMTQSSCGLTDERLQRNADQLPGLQEKAGQSMRPSFLQEHAALTSASPGGNMRGPVSDLGRFYEMLLRDGRMEDGGQFLSPHSVAQMMTPQRIGQFDNTLQFVIDMGLGLITQSRHHGSAVPYGYGAHSSERTVGHGGSQCAMGFCDPLRKLVVCQAANGLCGEPQHQRRNRAINEAIYEDLGFAG